MSLLRQIQDATMGSTEPIAGVLRRCMVLAARLDHQPLRDWVDLELNGYPAERDLPPYRIVSTHAYGNFVAIYGRHQIQKAPIPPMNIPEKYRLWADRAHLRQGVAAYEDLLRQEGKAGGTLVAPWPADLIALVGNNIYVDMTCLGAWQDIPRSGVVGLVDTVRSRVLAFALAIEKENASAGEAAAGSVPIPLDRVDSLFRVILIEGG